MRDRPGQAIGQLRLQLASTHQKIQACFGVTGFNLVIADLNNMSVGTVSPPRKERTPKDGCAEGYCDKEVGGPNVIVKPIVF